VTQRTLFPIEFEKASGRQKVVADFSAGRVSSDGGGLLLREVDRTLRFTRRLAAGFSDGRQQSKVQHSIHQMLAQRIHAIALGYEDNNDHDELRDDPLMQLMADTPGTPLASSPTLCRFENAKSVYRDLRALTPALWHMAETMVDVFLESHATPPRRIVLDFDATDDAVHGQQEGRGFHGYYDHYCLLPLYVFCDDHLLAAYLRPSLIDGAKNSRALLKLLVQKVRSVWPRVQIIVRGDSGFCREKLMRWCEQNDVYYIFGIARNIRLEMNIEALAWQVAQQYERTGRKLKRFKEFRYRTRNSWSRKRRVIAKAERNALGPNNRFIVTNLRKYTPRYLYSELYCARGEMENRIKEQQLYMFADRTSCNKLIANQFRLLLASSAYVLMNELRRLGLKGTELERANCQTIRLKLLKIGAVIQTSVRRFWVRLSSYYPRQELYCKVAAALKRVRLPVPT